MAQDKELAAMTTIAKVLDDFSEGESETVKRILRWAFSRYASSDIVNLYRDTGTRSDVYGEGEPDNQAFEDLADIFHAASPKTDPEKALVTAFWLTTGERKIVFTGHEVNSHLKNLGHRIGNITDALTSLMRRKPSLVMQTAKSGATRQARKKYKLTRAGLDQVRRVIQAESKGSQ